MEDRIDSLQSRVSNYLARMGLEAQPDNNGLFLFKYGTTAVMVNLFESEENTFVRFASTLLTGVAPNVGLVRRILRLNAEVLFGSFLLFEDNTLSFAATLLGNDLDFKEFETALRYVARVSDDYDDFFQEIAGGDRAFDVYGEAYE